MIDSNILIWYSRMQEVVDDTELGTSNAAKMDNISVCGKTGLLKILTEKIILFLLHLLRKKSKIAGSLCRKWWMGFYLGSTYWKFNVRRISNR